MENSFSKLRLFFTKTQCSSDKTSKSRILRFTPDITSENCNKIEAWPFLRQKHFEKKFLITEKKWKGDL